jgi:hypothetical protein
VPVVLSPITINNYGGSCDYQQPPWLRAFANLPNPPRPAARALNRLQELQSLDNGVEDPYFHLVNGGISDNLGLRSVLDVLKTYKVRHEAGQPTPQLPNEAVDRLRAAARRLILNSPDPHQVLKNEWRPVGEQPVMAMTATVTTTPAVTEAK